MLKLDNICKTFNPGTINEKKALQNLSLTLKPGDFVTVIGGNGAGIVSVSFSKPAALLQWMKFRGIVFHLHHKISSRDNKEKNEQRYLESIREHRTRCEKGLDRHLTPRITYTEKGVAAGIGG